MNGSDDSTKMPKILRAICDGVGCGPSISQPDGVVINRNEIILILDELQTDCPIPGCECSIRSFCRILRNGSISFLPSEDVLPLESHCTLICGEI
jgi:hypothetical protein